MDDETPPVIDLWKTIKGREKAQAAPETDLPLVFFHDIQPNLSTLDFVEGVFRESEMSVTYGETNCGKTFLMTDIGLHVALSREWHARQIEGGGVIYCALEGRNGILNRVAAFRQHHKLSADAVPFAVIPSTLNMLDPAADPDRLIHAIKAAAERFAHKVKMVIIDTVARALSGGNENSPEDMGALVVNTDRVRQQTGAHINYVHHSGKDQARGMRGHSSLVAAIDTEIEVTRDSRTAPSVASVRKQRELECSGTFTFTLQTVELGQNTRGKPVTSCVCIPAMQDTTQTGQNGTSLTKRLSPNAQLALRALTIALSKHGALLPPLDEYPHNTIAVAATQWKHEFNELKPGSSPDTLKHAFSNGQTGLLAANSITARNGFVWLVRRDRETGQ